MSYLCSNMFDRFIIILIQQPKLMFANIRIQRIDMRSQKGKWFSRMPRNPSISKDAIKHATKDIHRFQHSSPYLIKILKNHLKFKPCQQMAKFHQQMILNDEKKVTTQKILHKKCKEQIDSCCIQKQGSLQKASVSLSQRQVVSSVSQFRSGETTMIIYFKVISENNKILMIFYSLNKELGFKGYKLTPLQKEQALESVDFVLGIALEDYRRNNKEIYPQEVIIYSNLFVKELVNSLIRFIRKKQSNNIQIKTTVILSEDGHYSTHGFGDQSINIEQQRREGLTFTVLYSDNHFLKLIIRSLFEEALRKGNSLITSNQEFIKTRFFYPKDKQFVVRKDINIFMQKMQQEITSQWTFGLKG